MNNDSEHKSRGDAKEKTTEFQLALNQAGITLPEMDAGGALYISAVMDYVTSVAIKRSAKLMAENPSEDLPPKKKPRLEPIVVQRALERDEDLNPLITSTLGTMANFSKTTICIDGDSCTGKTKLAKSIYKQMAQNQSLEPRICLELLCPKIVSDLYEDPSTFYAFQIHAITSTGKASEIRKLFPRACLLIDRGSVSLDALALHFVAKKYISAKQFHVLRSLQKYCFENLSINIMVYIFEEDLVKAHEVILQVHPGSQLTLSDIESISDLRFELLLRQVAEGKRKTIFFRRELLEPEDCLHTISRVYKGLERAPRLRFDAGFLKEEEHRSKSRLVYSNVEQLKGAIAGIERTSNIRCRIADTVYFHISLWNSKQDFRRILLRHLSRFEDICLYKNPEEDLDSRTSSVVKFLWPAM